MVKRYDIACDGMGEPTTIEDADGEYVRIEDYAALEAKLDRAAIEQALRDIRQAQRSMETSNGYVTIGRRLYDVEKTLSRIVEKP